MGRLFERIGGPYQKEAQRIAGHETFEESLIHAIEILRDLRKGVLRSRSQLHGSVIAGRLEIDQHRRKLALRQHRGKIYGHGGGPHAAFGSDKSVHPAQLDIARAGVLRRALQTSHGIPELASLERLQQKLVGAGAHAGDHGLAIRVEIGGDHEQTGRRLFDFFDFLDGGLGIAREVHDQPGARMPFPVLQYANVKIRCDLLILRDNLRIRNIQQIVPNHFTEMFVARCDHQCGAHGVQLPEAS